MFCWKINVFFPLNWGNWSFDLMEEFFPEILNVEFTANMEADLDKIEEGTINWVQMIDEFYQSLSKTIRYC